MSYVKALLSAIQLHEGQFRKGSDSPFYVHPLRVSELVLEHFGNHPNISLLRKVALLHDTLEDTSLTFDELKESFGEDTAHIVFELTKDGNYLNKLANASDEAKIIKLLDIYDNIKETFPGGKWPLFLKKCENTLDVLILKNQLPEFNVLKKKCYEIIAGELQKI